MPYVAGFLAISGTSPTPCGVLLEDVVAGLPGVLECAVIAVPDGKSGEAPKLFVVRKDPALTETEILRHCRDYLTSYKIPRFVEFHDNLPKSNVGKILRRALRDAWRSACAGRSYARGRKPRPVAGSPSSVSLHPHMTATIKVEAAVGDTSPGAAVATK